MNTISRFCFLIRCINKSAFFFFFFKYSGCKRVHDCSSPKQSRSVLRYFPSRYGWTADSSYIRMDSIGSLFSCSVYGEQVRSLQSEAVLLFIGSGGHVERDFLSVELVAGRPRYVFDTGSGPRQVTSSLAINDGLWHDVGIVRSDLSDERGHWLVVDGLVTYDQLAPSVSGYFQRVTTANGCVLYCVSLNSQPVVKHQLHGKP